MTSKWVKQIFTAAKVLAFTQRIVSPQPQSLAFYGTSISFSSLGQYLSIAGAGYGWTGFHLPGQMWVYTNTDGTFVNPVEVVAPAQVNEFSAFGAKNVQSADGRWLVVSAPKEDGGLHFGEVYLYERIGNSYTHIQTFFDDSAVQDDNDGGLGFALSISADGLRIVTSNPFARRTADIGLNSAGFYNLYEDTSALGDWSVYSGVTYAKQVVPVADDWYGYDVYISPNGAKAFAGMLDGWQTRRGAVQVIDIDVGTYQGIIPTVRQNFANFGVPTPRQGNPNYDQRYSGHAITSNYAGTTCVISAVSENTQVGAAYYFRYNAVTSIWEQIQRLEAPSPADMEEWAMFGYTVDMNHDGDILVIGAQGVDTYHPDGSVKYLDYGAVYVYELDTDLDQWELAYTLDPEADQHYEYFGLMTGITDTGLIVAAAAVDETVLEIPDAGAVYIYQYDFVSLDKWVKQGPGS